MTSRSKLLIAGLAGAAAVAVWAATDASSDGKNTPRLRLLFTADGRGEIEPCG